MARTIENQTDLRGFTATARNLVIDALSRGWTAYLSNKGHAIMHWPHGGTESIARYLDGKRALENAKAGLARVERKYPAPVTETKDEMKTETNMTLPQHALYPWTNARGVVSKSVLTNGNGWYQCALCGRSSETPGGVSKHATKSHGKKLVEEAWAYSTERRAQATEAAEAAKAAAEQLERVTVAPEPDEGDGVAARADVVAAGEVELSSAVLELVRSQLVDELSRERRRVAKLRESIEAMRDLLTEVLATDEQA